MLIQDLLPPGGNILRTATATSAAKVRRALAAGLRADTFEAGERAAWPHVTTVTLRAATLRAADAAMSWFAARFLQLVLALERATPGLTHSDGWADLEGDDDYPFAHRFEFAASLPLGAVAADVLAALATDFYGVFDGGEAALEVTHGQAGRV
jgi:hypothetical protein